MEHKARHPLLFKWWPVAYVNGVRSQHSTGPVTTGSRRRRLILNLSQKDALQVLFQQNPYPGIATREWLAQELGIAESRVQVWFQNQRRRQLKQSQSRSECVHQEGEGGANVHAHAHASTSVFLYRILVQAFTRDRFPGLASREELARQTGIPESRMQVSSPASAWAQNVAQESGGFSPAKHLELDTYMVSKPKSSALPAEPKRACQWPAPRARWRSSHDYSCSGGPKGLTRCPEHLYSPSPLSTTGEHATLGGRSCSFWGPHILDARDCLWGLCGPAVDDLHGPAQPGGSPAKWEATTSSQVADPWAACSPAFTAPGQPGQGAILPPGQPEAHIPRWLESPYCEGTATPLEPQLHPTAFQAR
ncbi:double homeobox protein 4C-like [Capricornis sumatraensis]|uniref:double homeobox protein 4C-like n=1 Tax=Capricornis sumatraensis TaxID=34865 RepID=UPI003604B486